MTRELREIALEIRTDLTSRYLDLPNEAQRLIAAKRKYYAMYPHLEAMQPLRSIDDTFGADGAHDIVLRFLSNAQIWRGTVARRVKLELQEMVK